MGKQKVRCIESFIECAILVHGLKFDYSKSIYSGLKVKMSIKCPKHGEFTQSPAIHLRSHGCPKCGREAIYKAKNEQARNTFIERANEKHKGIYDYSDTVYTASSNPINIICPQHGVFTCSTASSHLRGVGCPVCAREKNKIQGRLSFNQYVKQCRSFFPVGEIVLVDKWIGINGTKRIRYKCPKHGWQEANPRVFLKRKACGACKGRVSKHEQKVSLFLDDQNLYYLKEHSFSDCRYKKPLKFDFYIPKTGLLIEVHGRQHYSPVGIFGGVDAYNERVKRDNIKRTYIGFRSSLCLLELSYKDIESGKYKKQILAAIKGRVVFNRQLKMAI